MELGMKFSHILLLALFAALLQGCPYIASGENTPVDPVSLEELQGCLYDESLDLTSLSCLKRCIIDSVYYSQDKRYHASQAPQASSSWVYDTTYYDTAAVTISAPEKDGYFIYNFFIWPIFMPSSIYIIEFFVNGFVKC
jgi:hypothetical protein